VEELIRPLRENLESLEAEAEVVSVDAGVGKVTLKYRGPEVLVYGITDAVKANKLIKEVEILE